MDSSLPISSSSVTATSIATIPGSDAFLSDSAISVEEVKYHSFTCSSSIARMAASSSSLFLLFLNLPHLLQHHQRPHCPALCLHSKNPTKRAKLRFPASLNPILSPLRQKLTPPRADDDGAGAVAREELDESEYLADGGGGSNGAGHAVGVRPPRHGSTRPRRSSGSVELISLGIKEPVYEVNMASKCIVC